MTSHRTTDARLLPVRLIGLVLVCLAMVFPASLSSAQDALGEEFSKRAEIEKRLAAAQTELRDPSNADPELRDRLQQLAATCQYHLAAADILEKARQARDQAAQDLKSWRGFTQPPPFSILLLDETRETLATLEASQRANEAQLRIFTAEMESTRDKLDDHQQAARRLAEQSTPATSREARTESVSARIAAELIARQTLRINSHRAELEMFRSKAELAKLQLAALQGKTTLTPGDLDSVLQRIGAERAKTVSALTTSSGSGSPPNPLLSWKIEFLDLAKDFWLTRSEAQRQSDSASRKNHLATLGEMKTRVDDWLEIAQLRISGGAASAAELDPGELRDAIQRAGKMQRLIGFTIADLEGGHIKTPVFDRVSSALVSLWNKELYLAEEIEIMDGAKTTTYRAVTLGKVVRLVVILIVGWLILRFVAGRLGSLLARTSRIPQSGADLAAKGFLIIGLVLLLIYGLNTARIPLTALAFLGGALAIGVGFGTQTILKNFISGIILIFERPLKVGDYVEVDGVVGTIRAIGMRASVINHGNGIETVIPNSNLLENKVTNWTLSDSLLRHSVKVGVGYDSATREVAATLLAVAGEHGLVLQHPKPEVRFDSFGEKSLEFSLLFWFDNRKVSRDVLASDLRYMIGHAFAEAGIHFACQQDDLRFDRETSLRVELSRSPEPQP